MIAAFARTNESAGGRRPHRVFSMTAVKVVDGRLVVTHDVAKGETVLVETPVIVQEHLGAAASRSLLCAA